jgi:monoterpene epsilon-lactone hydrolase
MGLKRFILDIMLMISRKKLRRSLSIYALRSDYRLFARVINFLSRVPKDVVVDFPTVEGIYNLRLTPPEKSSKVILYFHGGAFIIGLKDLKNAYIPFGAMLAKTAHAEVWMPDYRNAPEQPFPAQNEDCLKSYLSLINNGVSSQDIIVMGDSCGGALALSLVQKLRDEGLPLPGGVATISPWTDLCLTANSIRTRASRDPMFQGLIKGFADHYLQGADANDPMASPYYGDFTDFPPMYMIVGGREMLYDDTTRVAAKAKDAGVDVTLDAKEDMIHIYPIFYDIIPEGRDAIDRLADFIKNIKALPARQDAKTQVKL